MTREETDLLRREVKKKMIDHGFDRTGSKAALAAMIAERRGRPVNTNSLGMALTGQRFGPSSQGLLKELNMILDSWQQKTPVV